MYFEVGFIVFLDRRENEVNGIGIQLADFLTDKISCIF
jgi:hypothetical protein